jgi:hypothetical protein
LTFVWDPRRSRLSLRERELESGDNIFITYSSSNHNYENFTVGSGRVSSHFGFRVISGRVSSHLVSCHFEFQVRSGRLSGHFGFRIISSRVGLSIGSFSVGLFRILNRIESERVGRIYHIMMRMWPTHNSDFRRWILDKIV